MIPPRMLGEGPKHAQHGVTNLSVSVLSCADNYAVGWMARAKWDASRAHLALHLYSSRCNTLMTIQL